MPRERSTQPQIAGAGLTGFAGSVFIALFVIFCYFMLLGIKIFMAGEIPEREVEKPFASIFFFCRPPEFIELGRRLRNQTAIEPSRILAESFRTAV